MKRVYASPEGVGAEVNIEGQIRVENHITVMVITRRGRVLIGIKVTVG